MGSIDYLKKELNHLIEDKGFLSSFSKLQMIMHETAVAKGWYNPPKTFGEECMMMVTEIAEAIEEYRTNKNVAMYFKDGKPEGIGVEFADLFIRLLDICERYDYDLLSYVFIKAKYNLDRTYRHGNKTI